MTALVDFFTSLLRVSSVVLGNYIPKSQAVSPGLPAIWPWSCRPYCGCSLLRYDGGAFSLAFHASRQSSFH